MEYIALINWDTSLKVLEGISYVCAIFIAYIAYKGLEQIKVARRVSTLASKRDALRSSQESVDSFFSNVLPRADKSKITTEERKIVDSLVLSEDLKIDSEATDKKINNLFDLSEEEELAKYKAALGKAFNKKREMFNLLESLSSAFTSGLADEKKAWIAIGMPYCDIVEPYINLIKLYNASGYYNNIVTLYTLWEKRIYKEAVSKQAKSLEADLRSNLGEVEKMKLEINAIEDKEIVSLGTD